MYKITNMLKYLFVRNAPEFHIAGNYQPANCVYTEVVDANIVKLALKTPVGWMKFNVVIKGLNITKECLVSKFDYTDAIENLIKFKDITVRISQINNKYGVLDGAINFVNIDGDITNLKDELIKIYSPHLIKGIPMNADIIDAGINIDTGIRRRSKLNKSFKVTKSKHHANRRPKKISKIPKIPKIIESPVVMGTEELKDSESEPKLELELEPEKKNVYIFNSDVDIDDSDADINNSDWSVISDYTLP